MNYEEYMKERAILSRKLEALNEQFAFDNNPHKVGDIIQDAIGCIKIERFWASFCRISQVPVCVYYGLEYRKDGKPSKKGRSRYMFQQKLIARNRHVLQDK